MTERVEKTDAEWEAELDLDRFQVLRCGLTEAPWSGQLNLVHDEGVFRCGACSAELFRSDTKFESGTGWPSFFEPVAQDAVDIRTPTACGAPRSGAPAATPTSATSSPTARRRRGWRYCMNSLALAFDLATASRTAAAAPGSRRRRLRQA